MWPWAERCIPATSGPISLRITYNAIPCFDNKICSFLLNALCLFNEMSNKSGENGMHSDYLIF